MFKVSFNNDFAFNFMFEIRQNVDVSVYKMITRDYTPKLSSQAIVWLKW